LYPASQPHCGNVLKTVTARSPRLLGDPYMHICPALGLRRNLFPFSFLDFSAAPMIPTMKAFATLLTFEALSHGFCTRCLRFTLRSPSRARLASGWPLAFTRQGFHLLGHLKKFHCSFTNSLLPVLAWRQGILSMELKKEETSPRAFPTEGRARGATFY
jgi:hypothetical protein